MKNVIKYIVVSLIVTVIIVSSLTNIEALNYSWTWGGNRASWTYSDSGYVYPSHSIHMKAGDSIYLNGVTLTSGTGGGGIAASDNLTFTGRDSTTDLWRFGDSVRFSEHVLFKDTLKVSNAIAIMDSLKLGVDMSMLSDSSGINWTSGGLSQIYQLPSPASILAFKQNEFDFFTKKGNQILYLDSLNGMTLNYGVYTGNGSGLTNVNAITLKGQDTTKFARTDTLTTEKFSMRGLFTDIVTFATTVTFTVSPVFSALVNFANGINVTGNATVSGDLILSGWFKNQSSSSELQYTKEKIFKFKAGTIASPTVNVAHGLDWHNVYSFGALIKDDTLNYAQQSGEYFSNGFYVRLESLNVVVTIQGTAYGIAGDSGYVWVRYLDPNR